GLRAWQHIAFEVRQRRRSLARTEIRPDNSTALPGRIGDRLHLLPEVRLRRFIGHINAVTGGVKLPSVVHTAQAVFLVPAEEQGSSTMWAVVLDQSDVAAGVAEGNELFAEHQDPQRITVRSG